MEPHRETGAAADGMTKDWRREKFLIEHPGWTSATLYHPRVGNMKMRLLDAEERRWQRARLKKSRLLA